MSKDDSACLQMTIRLPLRLTLLRGLVRWAPGPSQGFPGGAGGEESTRRCQRRKGQGFDPWAGKIAWSKKWQLLQNSCLENSMNGGTWWATESRTCLSMHAKASHICGHNSYSVDPPAPLKWEVPTGNTCIVPLNLEDACTHYMVSVCCMYS